MLIGLNNMGYQVGLIVKFGKLVKCQVLHLWWGIELHHA
uniref:Uncharacterized protein n=1 Tax=Rhizophora mucronata TaxID=61149 RepID=A0A2P2JNP9_RHIMU